MAFNAEMGDRGHNRHGPKRGGLLCPFCGSWDPSSKIYGVKRDSGIKILYLL